MKNFKKITLGLLGVTLLTACFYSCSNDNEILETNQTEAISLKSKSPSAEVFLRSYYNGITYQKGRETIIKNEEGEFKLAEILFDDENRVGYIVEDVQTAEFLYFADKNLIKDEIVFQNIKTQEKDVLSKVSVDSLFRSTKKFDLIYIVGEIKLASPIALGWGKRFNIDRIWKDNEENCGKAYRDGVEGSATLGQCVQDCTYRNYRFFIGGRERSLDGVPTGDNNC